MAAFVLAGLLGVGCSGGEGTTELRSDVIVLKALPPSNTFGLDPTQGSSSIDIGDVVRHEGAILATANWSTDAAPGTHTLLRSDDEGVTWEGSPLPGQIGHRNQPSPYGMHSAGGRLTISGFSEIGGDGTAYRQLLDVDFNDRELVIASDDDDTERQVPRAAVARGGAIAGSRTVVDPRGPVASWTLFRYDVETRERSMVSGDGGGCAAMDSGDGDSFTCYGNEKAADLSDSWCRYTLRDTWTTDVCISDAFWPEYLVEPLGNYLTSRGVAWIWKGAGRVFAVFLDPQTRRPDAVDLGPGDYRLHHPANAFQERSSLQPRFASLIPVHAPDGRVRLVDVPPDGSDAIEVVLPSPCVGDAPCGDLRYLFPLGPDQYLAFYHMDASPSARLYEGVLFVHRVTASRRPLALTDSPVVPWTGPAPTTRLEEICSQARGCFYDNPKTKTCEAFWSAVRGASADADEAYQRFLATEPYCGDFARTWPEVAEAFDAGCNVGCMHETDLLNLGCTTQGNRRFATLMDCSLLGARCAFAVAGPSCIRPNARGLDCGTCSDDGDQVVCEGGRASTLVCEAFGQSCVDTDGGGLCTSGRTCDADAPFGCDGAISYRCTSDGYRVEEIDCGRIGESCRMDERRCLPERGSPDCVTNPDYDTCSGSRHVYCRNGQMREVDCSKMGFSTCMVFGGRGRCYR